MLRNAVELSTILSRVVAERLKTGLTVEPLDYEHVTVFFSDVHQFAQLTSRLQPLQIVELLNSLYTLLDGIIDEYDVYKVNNTNDLSVLWTILQVETINDSYMVASGVPNQNGYQHAANIADMALHFQLAIASFYVPHLPTEQLQLRIGSHLLIIGHKET